MKKFCTDCHAVYSADQPFNGCNNLFCRGETLVINDENFDLLQEMNDSSCRMLIKKYIDFLGSVYFLEIEFEFCSAEKSQEFYEKVESVIDQVEGSDKVIVYEHIILDGHHVVTIEHQGGHKDLLCLSDMEKVQAIFKFKEVLQEIFVPKLAADAIPSGEMKSA